MNMSMRQNQGKLHSRHSKHGVVHMKPPPRCPRVIRESNTVHQAGTGRVDAGCNDSMASAKSGAAVVAAVH